MATQNLFDNDNSGATAELDANFTQTFARINKISTASDTLTAGTFVVHFDASLRAIFGHTSAATISTITPAVQNQGTTIPGSSYLQALFANSASGSRMMFGKSRNTTLGLHTIVQSGDSIVQFTFAGSDGTDFIPAAQMLVQIDGTPGTNDMPGRFIFSTTADGGSSSTEALRISADSSTLASGSLKSNHATGGVGYATGAGGTVTQATSKSTGVTLNTVCGQITMNGAALAASTTVGFTLTNSAIAAADAVFVWIKSGATTNSYVTQTGAVSAGSCRIEVRNTSGGSLSEALVLGFMVFKGVTS